METRWLASDVGWANARSARHKAEGFNHLHLESFACGVVARMDASPWESLFLPGTRPTKLACLVPWRPCAKTGTRDVRSKPKKPPPLCRLSGWSTDPGTCHCHRTLGQSCPWSLGSWPGFLMVGSRPPGAADRSRSSSRCSRSCCCGRRCFTLCGHLKDIFNV